MKKQNDYVHPRNKIIPSKTVSEVLGHAQQMIGKVSETPALDVQVLLAKIMNNSRTWVVAHSDSKLTAHEEKQFQQVIARRAHGEPLPYILGSWEFFGRRFRVNSSVLIPRAETEHLVEEALALLDASRGTQRVLELGTGSGCVAISLLLEMRNIHMIATDISSQALKTAAQNIKEFGVGDRIDLVQMDLFSGLHAQFDLICANLPYIPSNILDDLRVGRWEPRVALNGGENGLKVLRKFVTNVAQMLTPGGRVVLEIEESQDIEFQSMIHSEFPDSSLTIIKDLAGHNRIVVFEH